VALSELRRADIVAFFSCCVTARLIESNPALQMAPLLRGASRGVDHTSRRACTDAEIRSLF